MYIIPEEGKGGGKVGVGVGGGMHLWGCFLCDTHCLEFSPKLFGFLDELQTSRKKALKRNAKTWFQKLCLLSTQFYRSGFSYFFSVIKWAVLSGVKIDMHRIY